MRILAGASPTPEQVLEAGLGGLRGRPVRITALESRAMDTFSSHPIRRLSVRLEGGESLSVVFKRLRPAPGRDVRREVRIYERLLAGRRFGAPALWASRCDEGEGRFWLFLEDVGSWRLDWHGVGGWRRALRWLAGVHAECEHREDALAALGCLGEHGLPFYAGLAERARERLAAEGTPRAGARLAALAERLPWCAAELAGQPRTLVHGDLSGHNLMLPPGDGVRPLDWEWAAIGPAAWDVAKLVAGWGRRKPELVAEYLRERERLGAPVADVPAFRRALVHGDVLRRLWYLRWWIPPCAEDPAFVDDQLARMERDWDRLARG